MQWVERQYWLLGAVLVGALLAEIPSASGQSTGAANPTGGTFIEVQDGLPRNCMNITKSLISAYVVSVKANQNTSIFPSWIVSTKNVGVKINTTFMNQAAQSPAFNFPRAKSLRPTGSTNIVVLPLVMSLFQRYDLVDQTSKPPAPIGGLTIDIDFINVEQKGAAATVFGQLANFTKDLPIPPNPYTTGLQLFGNFANEVIDGAVNSDNAANSDDIGSFAYDLATSDDECKNNPHALTEGTTGVIFDYSGNDLAGIVKIADADNYCYRINGNVVSFAKKSDTNTDCLNTVQTSVLQYLPLNNPQIVFSFNPIAKPDAGTVTRVIPPQVVVNSTGVPASAIANFAGRLTTETEGRAPDQARLSSLRSNIGAWVQGIQKNQLPLKNPDGSPLTNSSEQAREIELPASEAREFDAARALLRCARVGIPASSC
jgi:hypothetical protein